MFIFVPSIDNLSLQKNVDSIFKDRVFFVVFDHLGCEMIMKAMEECFHMEFMDKFFKSFQIFRFCSLSILDVEMKLVFESIDEWKNYFPAFHLFNKNSIIFKSWMNDSRFKITIPHCSLCVVPYDMYYHVPLVIPKCGHSFCQKCIQGKIQIKSNKRTFTCP